VLFTKDGASLVVRIKTKMQIKMGHPPFIIQVYQEVGA
jgi:hypothetical protein